MTRANVLVINSGSSSLKFALIEPSSGEVRASGLIERLGAGGTQTHAAALDQVLAHVAAGELLAVGHRVVHGGEAFADSVSIDATVLEQIRRCAELAPLHNPANLLGIEAARERFTDTPQVAVFDTAFHQTMPPRAHLYAIPYELYVERKVRRYGFHGSSHAYVTSEAAKRLQRPLSELDLVSAHLGNGCSACAVKAGRSLDTTMGFTPLEGLVMGTRSGDVDPNLHQFLVDHAGMSISAVTNLLNKESGLKGLSGVGNDMRSLLAAAEAGHVRAALAIEVFCYRLAKAILGLCAALERIDALIFTGGIGEHAAAIRGKTLENLRILRPALDPALNAQNGSSAGGRITRPESGLLALVVPTNEELVIAREAARIASRDDAP